MKPPGSSGAAPNTPEKTLYYLSDALGSALALQTVDGRISARYRYDEFGIPEQPEKFDPNWPGPDNLFGYTGLGYDYYSGLTFANARYFDPTIGRFISEDTYEGELNRPLSQHRYVYVYNNPLTWTDPTGHMAWHQIDDLGLGVFDALKDTVKDLLSWDTYVGIYEFGKALVKGEITFADLAKSLGNSVKAKIDYFAQNTKHVFAGKPTNKEVRRYGYEVGEILTMIGGSSAAVKLVTKVAPKLAKLLNSSKLSKASKACNCFTAGTKVLTDEGEKNIEDVKVGDRVLSKSEYDENGELAYKEVTALYTNYRDDIIKLYIGDLLIETTDNHPFWVEGKGWVFADELQVGDKLQKADGSNLTIDKLEFVLLDEPVMVYNFTVADYHTYYVTNLGIWVHNTNCPTISTKSFTLKDGMTIKTNDALKAAEEFLGKGYKDMGNGRYVSADGTRVVRMGDSDILGKHGGGPHMNFETLVPNPNKQGKMMVDKNLHIYLEDSK